MNMGDQEAELFGSENGGDGADSSAKSPSQVEAPMDEAHRQADEADEVDEEKEDKEVHQVMKRPSSLFFHLMLSPFSFIH